MAESETPNGGTGREGGPRAGEGDLLSERRARRAAETGEAALMRRAEAAEATVQTLERHVASLQQRLGEAEDERRRLSELVEVEREATLERESELRRVKQREYAEQQQRVEAEDRLLALDRDSRLEVERLGERLDASERQGHDLARRLTDVQRQLAEAEQGASAQLASVRADLRTVGAQDLQARVVELEQRAGEIQHGLESERVARARSERALESMREGHRRMEELLGEMRGVVARATAALGSQRSRPAAAKPSSAPPQRPAADMADALAAAVERLRTRAQETPLPDEQTAVADDEALARSGLAEIYAPAPRAAQPPPTAAAPEAKTPAAVDRQPPPGVPSSPSPSAPEPQPAEDAATSKEHKHARSLIGRLRMRRKQRRARR